MSTIRRRVNGTHQAIVTASGFPHTTRTFHSAEAARVWALFSENELKGWGPGRKQTDPDITLRQGLMRYLQEVTVLKKSCDTEARRIAHWCEHPLADRPMHQITGADLSNHRNLRLRMGRSADTVRLELAVVSHLYEVARTDWGLRGLENPRKDMRRMPIGSARTRRLRGGELEILKRHCEERGMMMLWWCIVLAIETAMRRSEMVRLRWEHIDFDDCLAYLDQTKTGTARIVPLSTRAVKAFRCLGRSEDGRVLPHHPDTITYWFVQACKANGIVGLRFHDLRHEATSRLFEMGFSMMEVAAVTGHKSTQMLKRYTHLNPSDIVKRLG